MSAILIQPAAAAGFFSLFGRISVGSIGGTLNLPEGMGNIGGNGRGYFLDGKIAWSPAAHNDGSFSTLLLGDDIYIYAVQNDSGTADWLASKNATVPNGYTADNSRKIGGFHYGRYRTTIRRYDAAHTPSVSIIPNSCWDLSHRPTCDPAGMVEIIPGQLWCDIYLNSEGTGSWPNTLPVSRYGATPLSGTEGYSRYLDLPVLAANAGKRLPTLAEYFVYADGAPQGNDADNDTAWSATTNTGRAVTGHVPKAVSCLNVVDTSGNLWAPLLSLYDRQDQTWTWDETINILGKDAIHPRGDIYHQRWRFWMAGGSWGNGRHCGARCASSGSYPENVGAGTGLRCVAPARRQ